MAGVSADVEDDGPQWRNALRAAQDRQDRADARILALEAEIEHLRAQLARVEERAATYHAPTLLSELKPRLTPPPGMTAMQAIAGQWPGDETQEELLRQLKELG